MVTRWTVRCLPFARALNEKVANWHLPALGAALNVPTQDPVSRLKAPLRGGTTSRVLLHTDWLFSVLENPCVMRDAFWLSVGTGARVFVAECDPLLRFAGVHGRYPAGRH